MSENFDSAQEAEASVADSPAVDPYALEHVDLKSVDFGKPGRKERAYPADKVDQVVDLAQAHLDHRAALVDDLKARLEEVASAPVEDSEEVGSLKAANAELRRSLQEALNSQPSVGEAVGLLEHAHRVAEEHIAAAREEAAQIVQDAHDSLATLNEEIERAKLRKQEVFEQIRSLADELRA